MKPGTHSPANTCNNRITPLPAYPALASRLVMGYKK